MKPNRPLIYLAVAIAVALAIFLIERPEMPRIGESSDRDLIPDFDSVEVARVEVSQLLDGCALDREGEGWRVAELATAARRELAEKEGRAVPEARWYRADRERVSSALGSFGGLAEGLLVSENPDKQAIYRVSDALGLKVRLVAADGDAVADIVIGKGGPDFDGTYVRRAGEKDVFLVRRPLAGVFSPRAEDWRDRRLWALDPGDIEAIEVGSPKGGWRMERNESGAWRLTWPDEREVDAAKSSALLAKLSGVTASGFADDSGGEPAWLKEPAMTIGISAGGGRSFKLLIAPQAGAPAKKGAATDRRAMIEGSEEQYLIPAQFVEEIQVPPS